MRLFTISFGSPASRPVNKSWRGGRRVMKVAGKKRGSPSETTLYKTHQQTKSTPKRRAERANSTSRNEDICGMGSRLSKRKRTNMFDSLDPRVMEATTKARYVLVYILLCFLCLMIASCLPTEEPKRGPNLLNLPAKPTKKGYRTKKGTTWPLLNRDRLVTTEIYTTVTSAQVCCLSEKEIHHIAEGELIQLPLR